MEKIIITHFQEKEDGDVVVLLSNGKVFRKTENGGPYYWTEEPWLQELIEYEGKEQLTEK